MDSFWYKDKRFWVTWGLHVLVVSVLAWIFAGPVFRITLTNSNLNGSNAQVAFFLFVYLITIWIVQLIALRIYPATNPFVRWSILLGAYLKLIGPAVAIALAGLTRLHFKSKGLRWVLFFLFFLFAWKILQEVLALWSIFITEIYFAF